MDSRIKNIRLAVLSLFYVFILLTSTVAVLAATSTRITDIAQADLTPDTVISGQTKVPLMTFTVKSSDGSEKFQSIKVQYSGTNKNDISTMYLYNESGVSGGTFDPNTDFQMDSDSNPTGGGEFNLNPTDDVEMGTNVSYQFYIVADIASGVTIGNIVDVKILKDKIDFASGSWPNASGEVLYNTTGNSLIAAKPKLTVNKVLIPSNDPGKFNLTIDGVTNASNVGNDGTTGARNVSVGTHTVGETAGNRTSLANYTTYITGDCAANGSVTLAAGDNKVCNITNVRKANLTVNKIVINDNGGTKVVADFPLFVNGNPVTSGTLRVLANGTYVVSETNQNFYTATFGGDCDSNGNVILTPGSQKVCNITNNDQPAHVIVIKHVINDNGGNKSAYFFNIDAINVNTSGDNNANPTVFSGNESGTDITLYAGSYTISEFYTDGYTVNYTVNCSGTIANGETRICTVTNDDIPAEIHGMKFEDINGNGVQDDGEPGLADWTIFIDSNNNNGVLDEGEVSAVTMEDNPETEEDETGMYWFTDLHAGSYNVKEVSKEGWTQTFPADNGGYEINVQSGTKSDGNDFGNFKLGKIIVHKNVLASDDSEVEDAHEFTVKLDGDNAKSVSEVSNAEYAGLSQGTYTITEDADPDYDFVSIDPAQVTINSGDEISVDVVNKQKPVEITTHLIIIKHVINDNGGTLEAGNVPLFVDETSVTSGQENTYSVGPHAVSETNQDGYAASFSGDCDENGNVNLNLGEVKTCNITNNDIAPTLKLIKEVTNDNGGTANAGQWELTATGDSGFTDAGDSDEFHTIKAGVAYTLSEDGPAGYTASSWDCDSDALDGNQLTLGLDEHVTCTITNDDIKPKLTVTKVVVNDNGRTLEVADFPLFVDETSVTSGEQNTFNAGQYTVSETSDSGYTARFTGVCDSRGNVELNPGDVKNCTITNNDKPLESTNTHVIVIKHVINDDGGTATASNFTIHISGTTGSADFDGSEDGVDTQVDPGSYNVTEDQANGYESSFSENCSGSIEAGETKTCTVTNDDIAPKLTVNKIVVNDNGGTKQVEDFTLLLDEETQVFSGNKFNVSAGLHKISEASDPNYKATFSGDCDENGNIVLIPGDDKQCNITNDDNHDNLFGDVNDVTTNIGGLGLQVNGSSDVNKEFGGTLPVNFTNGENETIIYFIWNFNDSDSNLNLSNVTINETLSDGSNKIIISGISLPDGTTKTVYLNQTNDSLNSVCVYDNEIASLSAVSGDCSFANETKVECNGVAQSGYTCTDLGTRLEVQGLKHSALYQISFTQPAASPSGGGVGATPLPPNEGGGSLPGAEEALYQTPTPTPAPAPAPAPAPTTPATAASSAPAPAAPTGITGAATAVPSAPTGLTGAVISNLKNPKTWVGIIVTVLVVAGLYAGYYYIYRKK